MSLLCSRGTSEAIERLYLYLIERLQTVQSDLGCHGTRHVRYARGWYAHGVRAVRGARGDALRLRPPFAHESHEVSHQQRLLLGCPVALDITEALRLVVLGVVGVIVAPLRHEAIYHLAVWAAGF
tara:strand:- start:550 stop:924 length:375 start_codon:yes stop_codon:yes gene_type:complete